MEYIKLSRFGLALTLFSASASAADVYDLVIYGSTPAAISAAVQAKRMGASVIVVSPEPRLGGLTTGGLGQTDIGNKSAFGGIALEFYRAVADWYRDDRHWTREKRADYLPDGQCSGTKGADSMWTFEPSAALAILEGWVKRDGIELVRGERLDRAKGKVKVGGEGERRRILSFATLSGKTYEGKMFVDATYEGDLMAAADVTYTIGREANSVYGETLNGVQTAHARWHQFEKGVDPYVVTGDPKSGLLPGVEPFDPELEDGTGDRRVQAYCFRMCLTDDPANRIPFAKPADYDERNYELLFRMFAAKPKGTYAANKPWALPWINSRMPNRKTDTNNRDAFSTDFIGRNWCWPEASYEEREKLLAEHLAHQRGLMWTLANHPRVPEAVRREVSRWGTCRDEFPDGTGDGWQTQLYVREARRMVGEYVVTEHNCTGRRVSPRPVAMAAYTMDSHHVRRHVGADGFVHNEGDVEIGGGKPYGLDYGAIVPKRGECGNLLVPVCLSASHIAFGSIRMEPVFFALGQAAATAAVQANAAKCAVQDLSYGPLAARLLADGQVISSPCLDPIVPYVWRKGEAPTMVAELRDIHKRTGLHRFFIAGPSFNAVMFKSFSKDLYAEMGREIAAVKRAFAGTDVEIGWWCSPSIRYVAGFPSVEDAFGNRSADNKHCPLDPAFQADWAAKVASVVRAVRPRMINIEDDFTLSWGRGLNGGACFCPRHLAAFAKRYGRPLSAKEINAAFEHRTPENLSVRRAFAETVRDSLGELARKVREAVDAVDPDVRICVCEPGSGADVDGDALEAVARAFAGPHTRAAVRPSGAIYGAQTTPADVPRALAHTLYTLERQPRDIEMFYEADPYPHNRFFSSASQMGSLMSGAVFMGSQNLLLYCLQYLDDPLEDSGYADRFAALRPRLDAVRAFIEERRSHLAGVRIVWKSDDLALTRRKGGRHGTQLESAAFILSKLGIPYTTLGTDPKALGTAPAILIGDVAEFLTDEECRRILSGQLLLDACAASILAKRGFSEELGVDISLMSTRPRIVREEILPVAGQTSTGTTVNAFYAFPAGTEGTVHTFATLRPRAATSVRSVFKDPDGKIVTPALTVATNRIGGEVAVFATSFDGNCSSGLLNLRKQSVFDNLLLGPLGSVPGKTGSVPVVAVGVPGIWTMVQESRDGMEMMLMVNNLSGDERDDLAFRFSSTWRGAAVSRLAPDGHEIPMGTIPEPIPRGTAAANGSPINESTWRPRISFGQMMPEFFHVRRPAPDENFFCVSP